ncbi:hypothetical protein MK489_03040 [Myxococcota bacterium]|nr:hypothetical protein [Myxococcota bacterium]
MVAYPDTFDRFIRSDLPAYFGYEVNTATRERMISATTHFSKTPGKLFAPDDDQKRARAEAIPGLVELVERKLGGIYQEMLARSNY